MFLTLKDNADLKDTIEVRTDLATQIDFKAGKQAEELTDGSYKVDGTSYIPILLKAWFVSDKTCVTSKTPKSAQLGQSLDDVKQKLQKQ